MHTFHRLLNRLRTPAFQHGRDVTLDLKRRCVRLRTIFDVGANVGQTATAFARAFPEAGIRSFEPFTATFALLRQNTARFPNVFCEQLALGSEAGGVSVPLQTSSVNNSIRACPGSPEGGDEETIGVDTLDGYCSTRGVDEIDYLKIDTEGHDLEVLKGARNLLKDHRIGFVQVEAAMTRANCKHVAFAEFDDYLWNFGFVLFGIYEQTPEWDGEARLRFANPVFISPKMMDSLGLAPLRSSAGGLRFKQCNQGMRTGHLAS